VESFYEHCCDVIFVVSSPACALWILDFWMTYSSVVSTPTLERRVGVKMIYVTVMISWRVLQSTRQMVLSVTWAEKTPREQELEFLLSATLFLAVASQPKK
jgi:hypothetical protein